MRAFLLVLLASLALSIVPEAAAEEAQAPDGGSTSSTVLGPDEPPGSGCRPTCRNVAPDDP